MTGRAVRGDDRGQAVVELALVLPLVVLFVARRPAGRPRRPRPAGDRVRRPRGSTRRRGVRRSGRRGRRRGRPRRPRSPRSTCRSASPATSCASACATSTPPTSPSSARRSATSRWRRRRRWRGNRHDASRLPATTVRRCALGVSTSVVAGRPVVALTGALDLSTVPSLHNALTTGDPRPSGDHDRRRPRRRRGARRRRPRRAPRRRRPGSPRQRRPRRRHHRRRPASALRPHRLRPGITVATSLSTYRLADPIWAANEPRESDCEAAQIRRSVSDSEASGVGGGGGRRAFSLARCSASRAASSATRRSRLCEALGIERAVVDRRAHGAARLLVVLAVAEAALVHQLEHVGEGALDALARQPQRQRAHARRVDQPAAVVRHRAAARRRRWCGGRGGRRGPSVVACRCSPSRALTSVDLPTPLAPRKATVRPDAELAAQLVEPARPLRPLDDDHRHAEGHLLQLPPRRLGIVDEIGLGEHHDRVGAAVERQHQLALEPALVRRHGERVAEEDDVDVGGERVATARAPSNDARRTNAERRSSTCSTRSPSADATTQSPTATSAPMLRTRSGTAVVVGRRQHRAPAAVDALHAGRATRRRRASSHAASKSSPHPDDRCATASLGDRTHMRRYPTGVSTVTPRNLLVRKNLLDSP